MIIHKGQFEPILPKITDSLHDVSRLIICAMDGQHNIRQVGYLQNCQEALEEALVSLTNARSIDT